MALEGCDYSKVGTTTPPHPTLGSRNRTLVTI